MSNRVLLAALIALAVLGACAGARDPIPEPYTAPLASSPREADRDGEGRAARARATPAPRAPQAESETIPVGNSPVLGPPGALVTIVEFSDFECPYCARVQPTLRRLIEQYGADVRLVFKHNPLPFHPNARLAAEAAMEVHAQRGAEAFFRFHDVLYANQEHLDRGDLERYAAELQLDMDRFRAVLDLHAHGPALELDQQLAERLDLTGTPAFVINGTRVTGARPYETFAIAIDAALAQARAARPPRRAYALATADVPLGLDLARRPAPPAPLPLDPAARYRVPVEGAPARGRPGALVTLVVFSDFECPYCRRAEGTLEALRRQYGADLRVVWRNLPSPAHPHAQLAAEAAMEAFAQRGALGFWRYHDLLFANASDLARTDLERYALQAGLDLARFRAALDAHTHAARVGADRALGDALGVTGTPAFFANGTRLTGARPLAEFTALIDRERATARARLAQRAAPAVTPATLYDALTAQGATAPVYLTNPPPPPSYSVRPNANAPTRGPAGARVVIEVFSDFQCPYCARARATIERVLARYPSDVQLVWRDYPLPSHPDAMPAAEAAREAYAQLGNAGFWRMHDLLFAHQRELSREALLRYGLAAGLDMDRFASALDSRAHAAAVRDDVAAADATGLQVGTPMFLVNGRLISGARPLREFVQLIDELLGRAP